MGFFLADDRLAGRARLLQLPGRSPRLADRRALRERGASGIGRYFRLCTDHKVVGIQYFFGVGSSSSSAA